MKLLSPFLLWLKRDIQYCPGDLRLSQREGNCINLIASLILCITQSNTTQRETVSVQKIVAHRGREREREREREGGLVPVVIIAHVLLLECYLGNSSLSLY
jgi:hypothetical protein